ncbi:hypothetical protein [Liquorilactobacillus cacaonum]|nr:hypothetical protein [Liquorilactobacillus cacaonum]
MFETGEKVIWQKQEYEVTEISDNLPIPVLVIEAGDELYRVPAVQVKKV